MVIFNQKWDNLLEVLFDHPSERFTVRDISKQTKIPRASVNRYLQQLRKIGVVGRQNELADTPYVRFIKAIYAINKLYTSGLIEHLEKLLNPSVIVVFGSVRKGEYDAESDVDIFAETTKKKEIDLTPFINKIGREIQLFTKDDIHKLQPHLFNNVVNGIKLSGYIKIK